MFYYIKAIEPNPENYTIRITYSDDVTVNADFKDLLEKGIMKTLKIPMFSSKSASTIKAVLFYGSAGH